MNINMRIQTMPINWKWGHRSYVYAKYDSSSTESCRECEVNNGVLQITRRGTITVTEPVVFDFRLTFTFCLLAYNNNFHSLCDSHSQFQAASDNYSLFPIRVQQKFK